MSNHERWHDIKVIAHTISIRVIAALILAAVFAALAVQAEYLHQRFTPREAYFDYKSVEYGGTVEVGEHTALKFISNSIFKAGYPTYYNDILRCSDGTKYVFYSVQDTDEYKPTVREEYRLVEWLYNSSFPYDKKCRLHSTITMRVGQNDKTQQVISEEFIVEHPKHDNNSAEGEKIIGGAKK